MTPLWPHKRNFKILQVLRCFYGGGSAMVLEWSYQRSLIPKGALEIPITLKVKIGDASAKSYEKMLKFPPIYYSEPEHPTSDDDDVNDIWMLYSKSYVITITKGKSLR